MKKKTEISLFLADLRRKAGLKQGELDEAAGLPIGTVAHMEAGTKKFTEARISALAAYFNISENDFIAAIAPLSDRRHASAIRKIVEIATPLSEPEQHILLGRVMQMIKEGLL